MIGRRDLLIGAACLAAAGTATALRPRRHIRLLGDTKLEKLIPHKFDGWTEQPSDAIVTPQNEDSLAAKLYSQIVGRLYTRGNDAVMMLIAYGDTQNDLLQLHRPEVCYPAFGFQVFDSRPVGIDIGHGISLPGRTLRASLRDRSEYILYWTRLGEYLPESGSEQRLVKLKGQFQGIVPDGVLVRISNYETDPGRAYEINRAFAASLLQAVPASTRPALIGTTFAKRLAGGDLKAQPASLG